MGGPPGPSGCGLAVARALASILAMSRRSRQRGTTGAQSWLGKAALGLIVAGVLGAGILYAMVRGYLYSDAFRQFLSAKASALAQVEGQFTPFRWDGLAVDTAAFEATGKGIVKAVRLDGLHTEVGVGGLRRGVWAIQGSRVQRMEVFLDARDQGAMLTPSEPAAPERVSPLLDQDKGWLPREVELLGMDVREVVVQARLDPGLVAVSGMKVRVEPAGPKHAYRVETTDGTLRLPLSGVPVIRLDRTKLRFQDGQVFLNNFDAAAWQDGRLSASGEWDATARLYALEGKVSGVKCDDLFSENWAKRCVGDLSSDFTMDNHAGAPVARGHLSVLNGTLTALPVLEALAAYADTRRFRILSLSEAHADWRWQNGQYFLTNLVLASEGLVRVEGSLDIRGSELDGRLHLGLAPGTLASIPGAETDVFAPGARGLMWADLRLTGTLDHPKEDLTDRLVAAAGLRMFDRIPETGEKVIKFTRSIVGDDAPQAVQQQLDNLKTRSKTARQISGLLQDLLGAGRQPEPVPEPPTPVPTPVPTPESKPTGP